VCPPAEPGGFAALRGAAGETGPAPTAAAASVSIFGLGGCVNTFAEKRKGARGLLVTPQNGTCLSRRTFRWPRAAGKFPVYLVCRCIVCLNLTESSLVKSTCPKHTLMCAQHTKHNSSSIELPARKEEMQHLPFLRVLRPLFGAGHLRAALSTRAPTQPTHLHVVPVHERAGEDKHCTAPHSGCVNS
jgi:hypothetical protein